MPVNPVNEIERWKQGLMSMGFSQEASSKVDSMLAKVPDWESQFLTGETQSRTPFEDKTTIAPSLPGMDIDNRAGKQKGGQGKHKKHSSRSISPVAVPRGNPQQGPRSRSDLTGLAMFEEKNSIVGQCNQKQKREQKQQQRSQEQREADQKRAAKMEGKPVAPNVDRQAAAKKAAETRKRCGEGKNRSATSTPTTNPSGAGVGVTGGAGGGAGSGAGAGARG